MYSENLEELISLVLSDGNLTDEKRDIIKRRAEKEGEDVEEVMMVINSRLKKVCSHPEQKSDDEGNTQEKTKKGTETQEHLLVPENVVPKVLKIINVYNKKASKWGYDLLAYNDRPPAILLLHQQRTLFLDRPQAIRVHFWLPQRLAYLYSGDGFRHSRPHTALQAAPALLLRHHCLPRAQHLCTLVLVVLVVWRLLRTTLNGRLLRTARGTSGGFRRMDAQPQESATHHRHHSVRCGNLPLFLPL